MNKTRRLLFGLFAFLLVFSPSLASAEGGSELDCAATPAECEAEIEALRNENARYEDWFRENGIEPPALDETGDAAGASNDDVSSSDIEMTGGEEPTAEMQEQIRSYESQLHKIALDFCLNDEWQEIIDNKVWNNTYSNRQSAVELWSTFEDIGYQAIYDEYAAYLQELASHGYNVSSRPSTMWELIQQLPGCDEGDYNPDK